MKPAELAEHLLQSGKTDILSMDISILNSDVLSIRDRHLLINTSRSHEGGVSVWQALTHTSVPKRIRDIVALAVTDDLREFPTSSADEAIPTELEQADSNDIELWCIDRNMAWVLGSPLAALGPVATSREENYLLQGSEIRSSQVSVLLRQHDHSPRMRAKRHGLVLRALVRTGKSAAKWVGEYNALRERVREALIDDAVSQWSTTAIATLDAQVLAGQVGLYLTHPCVRHPDGPEITGAGMRVPLLPGWPGLVPESPNHNSWNLHATAYNRTLGTAFLYAALGSLHEDSPQAQALREAVNLPSWHRVLLRVDRQLKGPTQPVDSGRVVVFRYNMNGASPAFEVGSAVMNKRGQYRARKETLYTSLLNSLADPADAVIIRQFRREPPEGSCGYSIARALIGHPRVMPYSSRVTDTVPVRSATLGILMDRTDTHITVRWSLGGQVVDTRPLLEAVELAATDEDGFVMSDTSGVTAVPCSPTLRSVMVSMGTTFSKVDHGAAAPLLARLPALGALVDVTLGDELRGKKVTGDSRLVVRARFDGGLWLSIGVRPLPELPTCLPGSGADTVHALRDGQPVFVERSLSTEVQVANALAPSLGLTQEVAPFSWVADDLTQALNAVSSLSKTEHRLEIDGSLPTTSTITASSVSVRVRKDRGWFRLEGSASTDTGDVDLSALLSAVDDGLDWISTSSGYVRLDSALREALAGINATQSGGKAALSAVHVPLIDALQEVGANVDGVPEWLEATDRVRQASALQPLVPTALNGTLRSYQKQGFEWLARLAHWAPGAVLADDMGLGKTIQSIALLLRRAQDGPALVVAPTSVGFNWMAELEQFAPSLKVLSYRDSEREKLLAGLGANTVLVTSYGILVRDAEPLAEHVFHTAIFDEAQALKNPASQRAKAAISLNADFRVALSGTPVENHVDDLWSVMACSASGLLGSHASFQHNWAKPIDSGDSDRRRALAKMLTPFLLRRTKAVVAPELPARTSVVHRVELSDDHRALYERSRALAVARIADTNPNKARFQVLAELTRLRQMACDPRLSDPASPVVGAKVRHLMRRLLDIRESGEKALVFSMFVAHLTLARNALKEQGFTVEWLTGSTSASARAKAVRRFQNGDADVFLLSTKAGGTGLNLTAASYVFHLDPWWNPAAEDQATDRAHRIGQDKPVTVYRLIATGTVEEKMLALQAEKRELVDALLSDSDRSAPISLDALRDLLLGVDVSEPTHVAIAEPVHEPTPPDWLQAALDTIETAPIAASSKRVYQYSLKGFDTSRSAYPGDIQQQFSAFQSDEQHTKAHRSMLRSAWRKANLSQ
jgi:superfamily II DNA or RNA helicase